MGSDAARTGVSSLWVTSGAKWWSLDSGQHNDNVTSGGGWDGKGQG